MHTELFMRHMMKMLVISYY